MVSRVSIPALIGLLGCSQPQSPRTTFGHVLYVDDAWLVVEHDTTLGRVVPGVEHYPRTAISAANVRAGHDIDLWLTDGALQRIRTTGGTVDDPTLHDIVGRVVRIDGDIVTIDHEAIEGLMGAMVMNTQAGTSVAASLTPGHAIEAKLLGSRYGWQLLDVNVTGQGPDTNRTDVAPLDIGQPLTSMRLRSIDGDLQLGGAGPPTALAFIYTTCPDPNYCPATVSRLQQLHAAMPSAARIVTVTIDPDHDTLDVLRAYAEQVQGTGRTPADRWFWGRLDPVELQHLALASGLAVSIESGRISHDLRLLVFDETGVLTARYDDNEWNVTAVARDLGPASIPQ